jgi:NAD(P)-dependent dehydrogenase (short-subunit alcohol dehydrogenase family)
MDLGIAGRKAIVCASSRGLGRACAKALAEAGCEVVINGRDRERFLVTANDLQRAKDARSPRGSRRRFGGRPEALFDACGAGHSGHNNGGPPFRDFRELDRQKMLDGVVANMVVAIELVQKAIDPMIAKSSAGSSTSSGSVKAPIPGLDLSSGARAGAGSIFRRRRAQRRRLNVDDQFPPARRVRDRSLSDLCRDHHEEGASAPRRRSPSGWPRFRPGGSAIPMNSERPARFFARRKPAYHRSKSLD